MFAFRYDNYTFYLNSLISIDFHTFSVISTEHDQPRRDLERTKEELAQRDTEVSEATIHAECVARMPVPRTTWGTDVSGEVGYETWPLGM